MSVCHKSQMRATLGKSSRSVFFLFSKVSLQFSTLRSNEDEVNYAGAVEQLETRPA